MSHFTVTTDARGKSDEYEDGSSYRIEDGVLRAKHSDNKRRVYAPGQWLYIDDVAPEKSGSRGRVI
jgi:hypothetical protein